MVKRRRGPMIRAGSARSPWTAIPAVALAAMLAAALGPSALAQDASPQGGAAASPSPEDLTDRKSQLRSLEDSLVVSDEQRRKIQADIEEIRTDRVRLSAALIETTANVHAAETKVAAVEQRLDGLDANERDVKQSLERRRAVVVEVLAVLQRMGRKPLPAVLVRPEDMLSAIRTAMLLGSVVPELRAEVETLAADLDELTRVRAEIQSDRDTLSQDLSGLNRERARLEGLVAVRQDAEVRAEGLLTTQDQRAADLARQATSLKDLISRLESGLGSARRAAEAARAADEAQRHAADANDGKAPAASVRNPARLAPATAFADAKGSLPFPAAGSIVKAYGSEDGFGSAEHGISVATRPHAYVASPSDGWVSFAGPYRSYGQLLIVNTGGGYYIVLAGMERVTVANGQFVLAGELVGTMGDGSVKTAASIALGVAQPILYVEFRKDGAPIDPSPWWAKADLEKVRG